VAVRGCGGGQPAVGRGYELGRRPRGRELEAASSSGRGGDLGAASMRRGGDLTTSSSGRSDDLGAANSRRH
jgi:hypothetical protein